MSILFLPHTARKTDKGGSILRTNRFDCRTGSPGLNETMNAVDCAGGP